MAPKVKLRRIKGRCGVKRKLIALGGKIGTPRWLLPFKYSAHNAPDGQLRSQEELHHRRARRPEEFYLGGCGVRSKMAIGLVLLPEGEPIEVTQDT